MLFLMEILLASNNLHKQKEFNRLFPRHTLIIPGELGIDFKVSEDGLSFLDNALLKARALFTNTGRPVLADDSGLCVTALGGQPGIYSARYGEEAGKDPLSDKERNRLLLKQIEGQQEREAFFVCCLVLILAEYRLYIVQETLTGVIASQPRGTGGFGYDPVFFLPELGKTVAELSGEEKNSLSHRGRAARRLQCILELELN